MPTKIPERLRAIVSNTDAQPSVFTAQSKRFYYCRDAVCEYVLREDAVPLNPFRVFGYFLGDRVKRDQIRVANNNLIRIADELWVFGTSIANGVLFEVLLAHELDKPVRFFTIATRAGEIRPASVSDLRFEPELHRLGLNASELRRVVAGEWRPEAPTPRLFEPDATPLENTA